MPALLNPRYTDIGAELIYCTWECPHIIPFNGQTMSNHTKLSTPSRSPLDFGVHMAVDMSNGSSRRVASGHQILPTEDRGRAEWAVGSGMQ
jgi:hypothetical protein